MGNIIQERLGVIIGSLVVTFVVAAIGAYVSLAVARDDIDDLEAKDIVQDKAIEKGLDKIDKKQDAILRAIQNQAIDAAKFHHEHSR